MATALITGASSGIGEAFARHLANMGYDLIIVARRQELLERLAEKLSVNVDVVVADLSTDDGISQVETVIQAYDDIAFLVNNAGFGLTGHFREVDVNIYLAMNHLHLDATIRLTHAVIPQMRANKNGAIINVASLGGLIPMPGSAVYNATKAYLVSFSESLATELKYFGITVQALCPGFTRTEIFDSAGYDDMVNIPDIVWMSTDDVVITSLNAIPKKRFLVTPGFHNQIAWRIMQIPFFHNLLKRYTNQSLR